MSRENDISLWAGIRNFIFPNYCIICGASLTGNQTQFCSRCFDKLPRISQLAHCEKCCSPLPVDNYRQNSCSCKAWIFNLEYNFSIFPYRSEIKDVILSAKSIHRRNIIKKILDYSLNDKVIQKLQADYIVNVPANFINKRARGFSIEENIADIISQKTGIPFLKRALKKNWRTLDQKVLNMDQRKENVKRMFYFNHRKQKQIKGKRILIVDDVMTTGSTLEACASLLKANGADYIFSFTLARA